MKLLLTRHGQAEDNVNGITMGQRDSVLTPRGILQAKNKAAELKKLFQKIDYIYTSDLGRCLQTTQIIADELGIQNIIIDKSLREISFGSYEGLPYGAIPSKKGDYIKTQFPEGESNEIMSLRVIDAVNRIYEANKEGCVLVVSHSGPIAATLASYHAQDLQTMLDEKVDNEKIIDLQLNGKLSYPVYGTE